MMSHTEVKQKQFLHELRKNGGFIKYAAEKVGIHRTTHTYWYKHDEVYRRCFEEALDEANEDIMDDVENALLTKARQGVQWAVVFYLKHRGRKRGYDTRYKPEQLNPKPMEFEVRTIEEKRVLEEVINNARSMFGTGAKEFEVPEQNDAHLNEGEEQGGG